MTHDHLLRNDGVLLSDLVNRIAAYHQVIRGNFNFGDNKYYLDYSHSNWLFDPSVVSICHMNPQAQLRWLYSSNPFSVFVASEQIDPLAETKYVQRTGICLIETAEIKALENRVKEGHFLSEHEAVNLMHIYPSESQLIGVKPVLNSEAVVYLEDILFEELWDKYTGGAYGKSRGMQDEFKAQIERTKKAISRYVALLHHDKPIKMTFVSYSEIFEHMKVQVNSWIDELLNQTPYIYDEKFYVPNAAYVLYTYGGNNLANISGLDETKQMVLTRPLSHCVLERGWLKNKSRVMDWFRDAVVGYFARNPRLMVGYLDLFDSQSGCSFKDTPVSCKVHYGCDPVSFLEKFRATPLPLSNNGIFQRGILCDFDSEVLHSMMRSGLISEGYIYSGRPKSSRRSIRNEINDALLKIYMKYMELISPLFTKNE